MGSGLEPFASTLHYITTTKVHPSFPFLIAPTLHAARISIAYQANARKSPEPLSWGTYITGYLIMCWGGGLLSHFMLGLPPPMLYSFGPWINYLSVHLVLTTLFTFAPSLLHPPTFDTVLFSLDALVRTNAVVSTVSLLSPASPSSKLINPLYVNSPLSHMIVGALVSSGGGLVAGTLGAWSNQWSMSTPPVLRRGVGTWGSLDVWGGAVIATVYGIATDHPAFKSFLPTILSLPLISPLVQVLLPAIASDNFGAMSFKPTEARALSGLVLTIFFGLRVYNIHWAGSTATTTTTANQSRTAAKKAEKKVQGKA